MELSMKPGIHNLLYVLECNDEQFIKIGICKDGEQLEKRLKGLQTGNPYKINVLYSEERRSAKNAEKYLHQCFDENRLMGEWFEGITLLDIRRKLMLFLDQS